MGHSMRALVEATLVLGRMLVVEGLPLQKAVAILGVGQSLIIRRMYDTKCN